MLNLKKLKQDYRKPYYKFAMGAKIYYDNVNNIIGVRVPGATKTPMFLITYEDSQHVLYINKWLSSIYLQVTNDDDAKEYLYDMLQALAIRRDHVLLWVLDKTQKIILSNATPEFDPTHKFTYEYDQHKKN